MITLQKETTTVCIRCGKQRIFSKKWKDQENDRGSVVTHVETICPDAECQKVVDEKFQEMRDRRAMAEERKKTVILARSAKAIEFKA